MSCTSQPVKVATLSADKLIQAGVSVLGLISPTCLCAAFTSAGSKSAKRHSSNQRLLALLGSSLAKAACKMLVKLTHIH